MSNVSYLDADVNLRTYSRKAKRWQIRETDGRFVKNHYSMKDLEARGQRKDENARQIEEEGDVLWA